jgi:hypothetical protein
VSTRPVPELDPGVPDSQGVFIDGKGSGSGMEQRTAKTSERIEQGAEIRER